jgi:hypothetical protein
VVYVCGGMTALQGGGVSVWGSGCIGTRAWDMIQLFLHISAVGISCGVTCGMCATVDDVGSRPLACCMSKLMN